MNTLYKYINTHLINLRKSNKFDYTIDFIMPNNIQNNDLKKDDNVDKNTAKKTPAKKTAAKKTATNNDKTNEPNKEDEKKYILIRFIKYVDLKIYNDKDKYIGKFYFYQPVFNEDTAVVFTAYPGFDKPMCYSQLYSPLPVELVAPDFNQVVNSAINDINSLLNLILLDLQLEQDMRKQEEETSNKLMQIKYYKPEDYILNPKLTSRYFIDLCDFNFDYSIISDSLILVNCISNSSRFTFKCNSVNGCSKVIDSYLSYIYRHIFYELLNANKNLPDDLLKMEKELEINDDIEKKNDTKNDTKNDKKN